MKNYSLSLPKLNFSVTFPDSIDRDFLFLFSPFIKKAESAVASHRVQISPVEHDYFLEIDGEKFGRHKTAASLLSCLEHFIGEFLVKGIDDWIAFHAGCVGIGGEAFLIPGPPDTGKTTTTFQFLELGAVFLCEEIAIVDAEKMLAHPFPRLLSLDSGYLDEFRTRYPVSRGDTSAWSGSTYRYKPQSPSIEKSPLPLKTILIPEYDPQSSPGLIPVSPGKALTRILRCCYPPNENEEILFNHVIKVLESCKTFYLRTNGIEASRRLINSIV